MRTFPRLSKEKNDHGHYEVRWSEEKNGKWRSRRRSTKTGDRTTAEAQLAKFLTLREVNSPGERTISELARHYLRQHSAQKGTEKSDSQNFRAPLGAFGALQPGAISNADIDAYTRARRRGEYGSRPVVDGTIRREITALQALLNWASKKELIPGNRRWDFPKPRENYIPRDRWLNEEQERDILRLIENASIDVRLFVKLALTYGVRKSAMMDLTWKQVSFSSGTIDFNVPGRQAVRKRRPVVPMTGPIREMLDWHQSAQGHVLARNTPGQFEATMRRIGYDWVTAHVLKHSAITLMLRGGAAPGDVAKLTATDLRTIYKTYRHHTTDELIEIATRRRL